MRQCRGLLSASSQDPSDPPDPDWLPSLELIFSSTCPTLSSVPATHRLTWARVLATELSNVLAKNDSSAWSRLFMLPKCILSASRRGGRRNRGTKTISDWQGLGGRGARVALESCTHCSRFSLEALCSFVGGSHHSDCDCPRSSRSPRQGLRCSLLLWSGRSGRGHLGQAEGGEAPCCGPAYSRGAGR